MGGCCFAKIALIPLVLLGMNSAVQARCLLADKYHKQGKTAQEYYALNICAVRYNDDEAQMKMAESYMKGENGLEKDEKQALYMYQLAAENGNAEAQVRLAELLQSFDTSSDRRKELKDYQTKLEKVSEEAGGFSGEIQHPYTLLLLASERLENKWYYPSLNRSAPARASALLSSYKISPEKRQAALKDASKWKTRKLLEAAKEVLSADEYPDFERRLKNDSMRTQAMSELKERVMGYVDKNEKERSNFR